MNSPPNHDGRNQASTPATQPSAATEAMHQARFVERLRRLAPYFQGAAPGLMAMVLAAALAAATEVAMPWLLGQLLDRGFGPTRGYALWVVPVILIGLFLLRGLADFLTQYAGNWVSQRAIVRLREQVFGRLLDAHPDLFGKQTASSLTNTLIYEAHNGATMLVGGLVTVVRDSLKVVGLLAYLLTLNWRLTFSVLVLAPALAWAMRLISRRLQRLALDTQKATDALAYVVEENVDAWKVVRLHGAQATQRGRFDALNARVRQLMLKSTAASALSSPFTQLIASVGLSAVIVVALWQGEQGLMTMGAFVAFVTAMLQMVSPLKHLADVVGPLTRGLTGFERGLALIERQSVEQSGQHAVSRARGALQFTNVQLRYGASDGRAWALDGVSLTVAEGSVVALVGPSGGGKTSLIHLVPRFVVPTQGEVSLDGVPLEQWQLTNLRHHIALVSQDVVFFDESVAANVALGQPMDEARVRQALSDAHLLAHVQGMPEGIHTRVGHNASTLSGGQRQRLAIARALYKDAPVLILDEATSALDTESERAVQAALERLMKGRTTIVIAHRLSTVEHADHVVVIDQGRIVEQGTPAALKAHGGLFARLHAMQFKGDTPSTPSEQPRTLRQPS